MGSAPAVDWTRSLVMVLSPDSFLRGVGGRILDEVLARGYQEIASRVVQPGRFLLDTIYDDLAQQNITFGTYRYRALDALYSLGSSLAIVLSGPPDIHRQFTALKGSGPLERAPEESIRRRYRAVNTILGLVHGSDSPQEAELDWRTFFVREWSNLGRSELPDSHDALSLPGARVLAALLDRPPGAREGRGFAEVRDQLRRAIVAHLWELLPAREAASVAVELADEGRAIDDEFAAHLATCLDGRADLLLRRALASRFTPQESPLDCDRLWQLLAGQGIVVDPWSRAVLATSQHFHPVDHGRPVDRDTRAAVSHVR